MRFAYLPAAEAILAGDSPYPALDDPILEEQKGYVYPPQLAVALFRSRSFRSASSPLIVDGRHARDALAHAPRARHPRRSLLRGGAALGAGRQRRAARERLDPACVRARRHLAVSRHVCASRPSRSASPSPPSSCSGRCSSGRSRRDGFARRSGRSPSVSVVTFVAWAAIGFDGLSGYPTCSGGCPRSSPSAATRSWASPSSSVWARPSGNALAFVVGGALLVGCVVFARRGDDARSFTCAVAATLALSPIVWLHYLVAAARSARDPPGRGSRSSGSCPSCSGSSPRPGYAEGFQTFMPGARRCDPRRRAAARPAGSSSGQRRRRHARRERVDARPLGRRRLRLDGAARRRRGGAPRRRSSRRTGLRQARVRTSAPATSTRPSPCATSALRRGRPIAGVSATCIRRSSRLRRAAHRAFRTTSPPFIAFARLARRAAGRAGRRRCSRRSLLRGGRHLGAGLERPRDRERLRGARAARSARLAVPRRDVAAAGGSRLRDARRSSSSGHSLVWAVATRRARSAGTGRSCIGVGADARVVGRHRLRGLHVVPRQCFEDAPYERQLLARRDRRGARPRARRSAGSATLRRRRSAAPGRRRASRSREATTRASFTCAIGRGARLYARSSGCTTSCSSPCRSRSRARASRRSGCCR